MVEKFEVGKYYKFKYLSWDRAGTSENGEGFMDGILDGKPHRCLAIVEQAGNRQGATFEGVEQCTIGNQEYMWTWCIDDFEEANMNPQLELF